MRGLLLLGISVVLGMEAGPHRGRVPPPAASGAPERWILVYAGAQKGHQLAYDVNDFTRLVTRVDTEGVPQAWLTTGAIFLQLYAPSGRVFTTWMGGERASGQDWSDYVDSLFAATGALARLDSAVTRAAGLVGPPASPFGVAIMLPYPDPAEGALLFQGTRYDFRHPPERAAAAAAFAAVVAERFRDARYRSLRLAGCYWLQETAPDGDVPVITAVAARVHALGLRFLWIPYFTSQGWDRWRALGFDAAWLQPNYFFDRDVAATRLDSAVARAQGAGMGLEIEFDGRMLSDPRFSDRLEPYLAALWLHPELRQSIAIYDGAGALVALSRRRRPAGRDRYEALARLLGGERP